MTVSTLRPNATTANTGTLTGAGSAHAALSDDSDASYINLASGNAASGGLEDLTLPAGAIIKDIAIRARVAAPSGTSQLTADVVDYLNGSLSGVNWSVPTTVTVSSVLLDLPSDSELDSASWRTTPALASNPIRVYEFYVDATYVALPVVSADAPTGTVTDTNQPTVIWSNTLDSDGGAQTYYEVKVYTDAEYGAGGFSPDTSTPTATSGITAGAALSWQLNELLPDDTYRAYVRVAQTVNSTTHWSAWDTADFVVDVDLPGIPTFVATADNANARIALAITDNPGTVSTDLLELQRSLDAGTTWESVRTLDGNGLLDVPFVVAVGTFSDSGDSTSHALVLPSPVGGVLTDDLLVAVVAMDGNPTLSWPSDWTELKDEAGNGSAVRVGCAYKRAVGGESGTITLTTSASEGGGGRILCVRGAHPTSAPEVSTGVSGSGANADPDALNPAGWGTENTLWIAAVGNDGNVAVTAGPSGYYEFGNTRWANASGAGIATATRIAVTASENPGTFTHTAEDTRAFTLGIRPRNDVLTAYDYEAPNGTTMSYRARTLHDYNGVWAASDWATDTEAWTSVSWWLKHPNRPALNAEVTTRSLPTIIRAARYGVFQALGATTAVVVTDTRGPETGVVTLRSLTAAAQADLDDLLDEVATLMLQSPSGHGGPDYIVFGDHQRSRIVEGFGDASKVWETLDFTVVSIPPGDVVAWP